MTANPGPGDLNAGAAIFLAYLEGSTDEAAAIVAHDDVGAGFGLIALTRALGLALVHGDENKFRALLHETVLHGAAALHTAAEVGGPGRDAKINSGGPTFFPTVSPPALHAGSCWRDRLLDVHRIPGDDLDEFSSRESSDDWLGVFDPPPWDGLL